MSVEEPSVHEQASKPDHRIVDPERVRARRRKRPGVLGRLARVGLALGIATTFFGGLFAWAAWSNPEWTADRAERVLAGLIEEAPLSYEQKASMRREVEAVLGNFEEGRLSRSDVDRVAALLSEGPFVQAGALESVRESVLSLGGLSEGERRSGAATVDRVTAGVLEGNISTAEVDRLLKGLRFTGSGSGGSGSIISDAQMRQLLGDLEARANELGLAAADASGVDVAGELRARIERTLGQSAKRELDSRAADVDRALEDLQRGR